MTITSADIKLLESERMTDTSDGGGRRTSNVIPDGVPGNIFPKVSRLDATYGRVNLRKAYAHVDTENVDTYAGAHAVLLDAADNEKISVVLFSTASEFDNRTSARDRIESYVVSGPPSRMVMYGRQLMGQRAITVYQRIEEPLPEVGEVFCVSNEAVDPVVQQFVRIVDVTHEVRTFTDTDGEFSRRVLVLTTSAPLRYQFNGYEEPQRFTRSPLAAIVRSTNVADAARYYGIKPLTGSVLADALELSVPSIFANIVPTASRETAISNAQIMGAALLVPTRATALPVSQYGETMSVSGGGATSKTITANLGRPIVRGSLQFRFAVVDDPSIGSTYVTDSADGTLIGLPTPGGQITAATVDYEAGIITADCHWFSAPAAGLFVAFTPAANAQQPAHVSEIPVTIGTRGTVYVATLDPLPAKGTAFVDYRALGKWYRLRDDGDGDLAGGDPAYGAGTVDPVTGALVVTLGALPDVGSSVIIGWASPTHYTIRANDTSDAETVLRQRIVLPERPVSLASVVVSFVSGVTTYNATSDGSGVISGNGVTGTVDGVTGEVNLAYSTRFPNAETDVDVAYSKVVPVDPDEPTQVSNSFEYGGESTADTVPNVEELVLTLLVTFPDVGPLLGQLQQIQVEVTDAGDLRVRPQPLNQGDGAAVKWQVVDQIIGTITFSTGELEFTKQSVTVQASRYVPRWHGGSWTEFAEEERPFANGQWVFVANLDNAGTVAAATPIEVSPETAPLTLDLAATLTSTVIVNTVIFDAFGLRYFDRAGVVYHSMQDDGTGTEAGTIDYALGRVTLTQYPSNTALGLTVQSMLTGFGDFTAFGATFRTAGSPLRAASTFAQVVALDGELLTATTDQDGDFVGASVRGQVNQEMGVARVEWGAMVTAAGNEEEPWYDEENVVGSQVWKPREVMPGTIRYSTVVQSNLPLNADILGIDPVRLPTDGRVAMIRQGDVILLHHTGTYNLPNPPVASTTYSVGRADVADLVLYDNDGVVIPTTEYTVDLAAGTVTMAADMDLGAAELPLKAKHRIEHLNLLADVQINGQLATVSPISRAFPEGSYVSSALLFGDMFARVTNVFDQVSWTSVWSDSRIGDNATAEYNTIDYPIEVLNEGAATERWRLQFTGGTTFQVIGENLGVIATGSTGVDCSPVNALTSKPYFTVPAGGWGSGWSVGNQLRFNTVSASAPIWLARTVLPGAALTGDSVDLQLRGDVDA